MFNSLVMHEAQHILEQDKREKQKTANEEKGWTKGVELCNKPACQTAHNVAMWNNATRAWYCVSCARMINNSSRIFNMDPLCVLDEDRKFYERKIKHQQKLTWKEYNQAKEIFTF